MARDVGAPVLHGYNQEEQTLNSERKPKMASRDMVCIFEDLQQDGAIILMHRYIGVGRDACLGITVNLTDIRNITVERRLIDLSPFGDRK